MRDLFKKVMTGSMVAGAALLVAACGGNKTDEANNTATTDMNMTDMGTTNDVTAIDGANGMDANMTMDANMSGNMGGDMGGNASTTTNSTTTTTNTSGGTGGNMTNGM